MLAQKATGAAVPRGGVELQPQKGAPFFYYCSAFLDNFVPLACVLLLWEGVARLEVIHPALFPTVTEIFVKMWELTLEGIFLKDVFHSLLRLLSSVFFAIIVGTIWGLLLGTSRLVGKIILP